MSELFYESKHGFETLEVSEQEKAFAFCEGYKQFLDNSKIERFCVDYSVKLAEEKGFVPFEYNKKYSAGDKIYQIGRGRSVIFAVIGKEGLETGFRITAAHVDVPKIDLKPNPLYEADEFGMFKTHYYGGIRKYQWPVIPLALCGVVCKRNGETVKVSIGDCDDDPIFCITDLLPHLAKDQSTKTLAGAFTGEDLNVLISSTPDTGAEKSKFKANVLNILFEKYGICEADFQTAELSVVPAHKARDLGLDRGLVAAFGQDDRVCAYPAFAALLEEDVPLRTSVVFFADKEEVGSVGQTGMTSDFYKNFLLELCEGAGVNPRQAFAASAALSCDVSAAYDPNFGGVFEKNNSAFCNHGFALSKYVGHGGKSSTSEANAEYIAQLARLFDDNNILWQVAELGKVDQGGGGTVSQYIAKWDVQVVDVGVPILAMHAPLEMASKIDIYMLYRACKAFYNM